MAPHLTLDERRIVAGLLHRKVSVAQIAVQLGRHRSTIDREIRSNFWHDPEVPMATGYWHMNARNFASARRWRQRKLIRHDSLRLAVIERLKDGWSPEQIAGRLRYEGHQHRVCHETIYSYVYSKDGQSQELARHLPERRRKRNARYARKPRSLVFPERCMIRYRHESFRKREAFGHWEADLMIFRREHGHANIATVVERVSRYTVLFRNNDRRSKSIMNNLIGLLSPLPQHARQSLTFDRGLEFVSWRELERGLGAQAWFCDPQPPGNPVERQFKPTIILRNNVIFIGSENGGEAWAITASLAQTCKLNGVDFYRYLVWIFEKITANRAGILDYASLLPENAPPQCRSDVPRAA